MKYVSNEQGRCPYCNHDGLEYDAIELEGTMASYPWRCEQCGRTGEEWYNLEFAGHNDDQGNIIELKGE